MTKDKEDEKKKKGRSVEGAISEAKGRAKEALGALTDDEDMKREGKLDRAAGEVKDRVSEAVDQVRDGVESLFDKGKGKAKK